MKIESEKITSDLLTQLLAKSSEALIDEVIKLEKLDLTDNEILLFLRQSDNIDLQCWALLKIKAISTQNDADLIVKLLLCNDSRMRELSSEVINNHFKPQDDNIKAIFDNETYYDAYIQTFFDINPRVTRNITSCFKFMDSKNSLYERIIKSIKYKKAYYSDYWILDAITEILPFIDSEYPCKDKTLLKSYFKEIILTQNHLSTEKLTILLKKSNQSLDFSNEPLILKFLKD